MTTYARITHTDSNRKCNRYGKSRNVSFQQVRTAPREVDIKRGIRAVAKTLGGAAEIGRLLLECREKANGNFTEFVESLGLNPGKAQRYIQAYEERGAAKLAALQTFLEKKTA